MPTHASPHSLSTLQEQIDNCLLRDRRRLHRRLKQLEETAADTADWVDVEQALQRSVALAAARAAEDVLPVAMAGCVGTDAWADAATRLLTEAGVDLSAMKRGRQPTGCATICVDAAGENAIAVCPVARSAACAAIL